MVKVCHLIGEDYDITTLHDCDTCGTKDCVINKLIEQVRSLGGKI